MSPNSKRPEENVPNLFNPKMSRNSKRAEENVPNLFIPKTSQNSLTCPNSNVPNFCTHEASLKCSRRPIPP